ncbi:golgin subfamily B member 1 isoform X2 [Mugil cephalus]|uniref:golgin subfamily B member 1 isoform X2 n=1 Tax=Mugil cephalus TaxID=48193 RepID=UPI001FB63597|nr:golgin subfamily B member 1 isoform X2 [Mugil cephalus]
MTSVEKRRSGRKSGGHRKHSDGGYSDTSSGGSFLDENDREVSSLTDRAFRSLCIGDEAVYNDSDLSLPSPCMQRDRQMALSHSGQDRDREREELKRAAHENFSFRMQQYGQNWIHGGMYGAQMHGDPQWDAYGDRTQGTISATFQHSFVETSQQENSLREEQLSFLSNGATELSSQQRRSRSRVSSLIRAFNSEGYRDGAGMDDKLREWNDETSWDKSALMSIQRELSEFSTSYQQNFNSSHFPAAGPFSSQDTNFYSSEVAAVAHMSHNSASSFMRASHSTHSMSAQVNCNSNFFIHSEFSPFKVWRDHNRFPFQRGEVSGFMHCSEFPRWYETPMYKEISMDDQAHAPHRSIRHPRGMAPVVAPTPPRSTSTSTMLQKASAVEKRCESELAGHFPHRKRTQSLGSNRLPSHRPSTASPTIEMSRRVRDTISSVKALQQKIKMMTEQNITTESITSQQSAFCSNDNSVVSNVVNSNISTTPFNMNQLRTPTVHAHQEAETFFQSYAASPQPVEHAPVRAESRGATPDVRMSSYKSRATSLLFNLKDNRKRVKSTYSPTKFKGLETLDKNKQHPMQELPRETVIDIPDFPDQDIQFTQLEESGRTNAAINQYHGSGYSMLNSQPATAHAGLYPEYNLSDYQTAQMQGQMVHHSGFSGFIPENYTGNQLANGQNLHEDLTSFAPYKQGVIDNVGTLVGDAYSLKPSYSAAETSRLSADNNQSREYLIRKTNTEQPFNETVGSVFTKVERYEQLKDNRHNYNNASSQDQWRQTNSQDTEKLSLKAGVSPWKQEIAALTEKTKQENQPGMSKEMEKVEMTESFGVGTSSKKKPGLVNSNISNQPAPHSFSNTVENPAYYGLQPPLAFKDKNVAQKYSGHNEKDEQKDKYLAQNYTGLTNREHRSQHAVYSATDKPIAMQETNQRKQYMSIPKVHEMQSLQPTEATQQFEQNIEKKSLPNPDNTSATTMENQTKDRQFAEVKQVMAEHIKAQHAQAELAKAQQRAQVEQPKAELARLILAGQTGSEAVKTEQAKSEQSRVKEAKSEYNNEEKRKEEHTQQFQEIKPDWAREEQARAEHTRVQRVTDEPRYITEEAGAKHTREEQRKQVKVEQAEAERLKEEHIKTELVKTEQAAQVIVKQAKIEPVTGKRIHAEHAEEVKREQMEARQIGTKKVNTKQIEADCGKGEQRKTEQMKEQQTEAEVETKLVEVGNVKADCIKIEEIRQAKDEGGSVGKVNAEQLKTQRHTPKEIKPEERKVEWAKLEKIKVEGAKADLIKIESMQERSAKLTAKITATQQFKSEPDKVEQVKTELAKAKAELAKIKEKMRGEQIEKVGHTVIRKEEDTAISAPLKVNINKKEENKKQEPAAQIHPEKLETVTRNSITQTDKGAEEYDNLREKYGFNNAVSTNINKVSATGNVSSNDAIETQTVSLDRTETVNKEKSKDEGSIAANTESKEEVGSSKVKESQYVYSESSKEFKLSSADDVSTKVHKSDKVKNDTTEKVEKSDPVRNPDASLQRDSDSAKPLTIERKPKSIELNVGPAKDLQFTPPRSLSHKEKAQSKQEILTSKIKAHAEKEISAIKEKGFALRDGFISKSSSKLSVGSVRQKPTSQEAMKKNEMSNTGTPKHQLEPSGVQVEPAKPVLISSSATTPLKSVATTSQSVDQSQKPAPKKQLKNSSDEPEPTTSTKQTGSTTEGIVKNQTQENQPEMKSTKQNKEHTFKTDQGKQQANHGEISVKQKEGLKDNLDINTDLLTRKKQNPSQTTSVKSEIPKSVTTEKAENKEQVHEDSSAPSINLFLGQKERAVVDDSLQIMGIMVTVRERNLSPSTGQGNNSALKQMNETERGSSNSGVDKHDPNTGREVGEGNRPTNKVTEDHMEICMKGPTVNVPEVSSLETPKNNTTGNVTVKKTNILQESSTINAKPQKKTQPEALADKEVPFTVTVPAKNKLSAETERYKEDMKASETNNFADKTVKENSRADELKTHTNEKNPQKVQNNENLIVKVVDTGIKNKNDASAHGVNPSVKEDITAVKNQSKISNIHGTSAPLVEEKKHDSTAPKTFSKASLSNNLTENKNAHESPKLQHKETNIGLNYQADDGVHIDSIAVRVVPAGTEKDNIKMGVKCPSITFPTDVVPSNESKQVVSSIPAVSNSKIQTKDLTPASSETKKDSLEDKLRVQQVLSSVKKLSDALKNSNPQSSTNANNENIQAEHGKSEKVKKSGKLLEDLNVQPVLGDYFQVQGVTETSNDLHGNRGTAGDTTNGRELPGILSNKTTNSNESHKDGKIEAFVFSVDQEKMKTAELRIQSDNLKGKTWETEEKLASRQADGSTETWSNNEQTKPGQSNPTRKHHSENRSSLVAIERQSSGNSHSNTIKEKPEVKPKPKERVSTIPEISALADYARLKVIVSEDRDVNSVQEFPPNKREGFFPLIQSRHSRRPVFTADPQEPSVKEKRLPNKTEFNAKANKEPKALVFPITEKEHQRTGMFKLDAKVNEGVSDNVGRNHREINNSPTVQTEQMGGGGNQGHSQVDQSICQPNNLSLQTTTTEGSTNSLPRPTMGQMHNWKENKSSLRKSERTEKQDVFTGAKTEGEKTDKLNKEKLATQHEETKTKQWGRIKQLEEVSRSEEDKREDMRIKQMLEESRASLAEEERRAIRREEERRAKEREAITIKIKERREKQKEAERKAEEERKSTQKEEERAAQIEENMRAKQREEEMKIRETEKRRIKIEEEKAAQEEQQRRAVQDEQQRRATQEEQQRRVIEEEKQRRAAQEEKQRRATLEEQQKRAVQEEKQRRAAQEEQQRRAEQEELQRRAALEEQQKRALQEEQQRRAAQEELQKRAALEEQQKRALQEEQQRRAAQEEQQKRALQEEKQRRAAQEEQQKRALQEERQRRAAQEEQERRAAQEEQQRRAALEEQQKRALQEERQRRAAQEEQQRRAAQEEQQRRAAQEEQQRRAALEEQQKQALQEEKQRRVAKELQMRVAKEEQERRAIEVEQQRRVIEEEQQRAEQQKRAAQVEQQRAAKEEQQRRALEDQQRAAYEEQQRRAAEEEQQRNAAQEEQQRRAVKQEQQRRTALIEEQRRAKQIEEKVLADIEEENKRKEREERAAHALEKERMKQILEQEEKGGMHKKEDWMRTQKEEAGEGQEKRDRAGIPKESKAALKEEKRAVQERLLAQREDRVQAKKREEEKVAAQREMLRAAQNDSLQYYAITSTESDRKSRERQLCSPSPSQQRNQSGLESASDSASHPRLYRPHAPASPAPSLPRSNTSSPALGGKPLMFRVKDNTMKGSSLTKSVKPRFHKNYGDDFWLGSPTDRGEEEQDFMRRSAGTPVYPDTGLNRLSAISESSTFHSTSSSQDYSTPTPHYRPYSRRSIVLDEDDSRSIVSNMSEDVESFATSTTDLADIRGLYDYDRPESACSFSSDVSRSLGRPPVVPPKSEKALRRAKRLATRRIKKELSKTAVDSPAGVEKEVSSVPFSSSSTELQ